MLDSNQFADVFKTTSLPGGGIPISTTTHVPSIPTIVPNVPIYEGVHSTGQKTLWVVFVVQFLSTLVLAYLAYRTPVQKRLFHIITTFITAFATLSYFAMATGEGSSWAHHIVRESHNHHIPDTVDHIYRQVFFARYIDWSITTPLLLLDLSFLAGLSGANILVTVVADLIMILTGLFAAFSHGGAKWAWYAMACAAYLVVIFQLAIPGRRAVKAKGDAATGKLFVAIGGFTLVLWTLYPIVWGIADGARKWSVDTEIIAYAVLDILAKPVFGFWLLFAHGKKIQSIDGFWSHGLAAEGQVRLEDDEV
ncbi:hypothetical protein B0O99DRAFT_598081 [Bisporella sp. PMI_857]|nr:hypothetical protein B0O99DRAFT_598081 [Bisporella sp. PMI_857]